MRNRKPKKVRPPLHEFFLSKSASSRIQEVRIAEDVEGRHVGSRRVSRREDKADVDSPIFLIEAKLTEKKRFGLTEKILAKIDKEAVSLGKVPAVVVEFTNFRFGVTSKWALIPYSVFVKIAKGMKDGAGEA